MKWKWKKSNRFISCLVTVSFLATIGLPAIVSAEEVVKEKDSSFIVTEKETNTGNSDASSEIDSSNQSSDSEIPKNTSPTEETMDTPIVEPSEDSAAIESEQSNEKEEVLPEIKEGASDDEESTTSELEREQTEENESESNDQDSEEVSEEVFSLEENRAKAMEILASLQNQVSLFSARSSALPHTTAFIYEVAPAAVQLGNKYGLYPSVMMAQAILETGWGGSTLSAAPNYNLFGIKGGYNGNFIRMLTSEYTEAGKKIQIYDNFKVYPSYKESFQDYVEFIRNTKGITRYKNVWRENAPTYQDATAGLVSGGYATDPAYATLLNNLISFNKLDRYDKDPTVSYTTHIQSKGWLPEVTNGKGSGTTKQNKRMEAIKVTVPNFPDLGIEYSSHVQSYGWMDWVANGGVSGTSGESKRMEAVKIKLTGLQAETYDIYYRVHAESYGWLGWAKNGAEAGTAGFGKRLEAIEIKIVPKDATAPGSTTNSYIEKIPNINYATHVQTTGWQKEVSNGLGSGTVGAAKRLEAIKVNVSELAAKGGIQYRTHIQSYGWQNWVMDNALSGTEGKAKRLEAIQIQLTGDLAQQYDVYYRVHAQTYGWLSWAKNGSSAGTEGLYKRLEAIEIKLVKKGGPAPGSTARPFVK